MERTLIQNTINKTGEEVLLKGWVNSRRDHGKIIFIDLRDRSGIIQVVGNEILSELRSESVVAIKGFVKTRPEKLINPDLETGKVEIEAKEVKILSQAKELPLDMSQKELDVDLSVLLDHRGLTLRHPKVQAIFKVQETIIDSFRKALQDKDFTEFQAPVIIPTIPEGGAEVFPIQYFDHQAYLAQSPQLYKSLLVGVFERVFSVNQICRAEPSSTTRHLAEATSLDAEMGFIDSWTEVRDMAGYVIKYIFDQVKKQNKVELELFGVDVPQVENEIPTIRLREAQEIIFQRTKRDVRQEKDLSPEDEREICRWAKEEHGSDLIFISHYITKQKPFYTYPDDDDPEFNQGFDLLGKGVEWMTGGRRIHDYETLLSHAKQWGVDPEKISTYLQGFKYGMPPLGGFAFGAERITMNILGLQNIREASMFPRDMERIDVRLSTLE